MALTQVSTDGVKDGSLLNADINASAAIAGTKISPDFGSQNITSTGSVRIGHSAAIGNASADNLVIGTGSGNNGLSIYSGNDSQGRIDFRDTTGTSDGQGIIFYQHTTDSLQIHTNSAERMRIDSSGKVGINTTSPSHSLEVNGNISLGNGGSSGGSEMLRIHNDSGVQRIDATNNPSALAFGMGGTGSSSERMRIDSSGRLLIGHSTGNGNPQLSISGNTAGATGAGMIFLRRGLDTATIGGNTGADLGEIKFGDLDGGTYASIQGKTNAAAGNNDYPGRLIFATTNDGGSSPAERMRIHNSGSHAEVFINCTETFTNAVLSLQQNGSCGIGLKTGATNSQKMMSFRNPNGEVGQITANSNNTTYDTTSDYRLKENEVAISDGITRLKTLKPYKFNFKNTPSEILDGFYAHEVMTVVPQAVVGEKDEVDSNGDPKYQGIDHSMIVPLLTAALKEAVTKIETLETKVAALEAA